MAEMKRLCHICGDIAKHTCGMCGRPACDRDFDSKLGICSSCKRGRMMGKGY